LLPATASVIERCSPPLGSGYDMATGTVKWFNPAKGFGFIQPDGGGQDVFVHISAVERAGMSDLQEGQKISFELEDDRKSGKKSAGNLKQV
jgi:CspA family cold shock protein